MTGTPLSICERIAALDQERRSLESELYALTGKTHEEFLDGMRRLMDGGMTIRVGDGPEMTPDEFIEANRTESA
jgi:hypothetical protein